MTTAETKDCAHVCTTEVPPANWVGNLIPAAKRYDATAIEHQLNNFSDDYFWRTTLLDPHWQLGHRHNGMPHYWSVHLRQQIDRHTWTTDVHAATDDFGWLVEVPAC